MSFLDYDYDDLARQVQTGLERLGIGFLRAHGARMLRDLVDFHGYERVDLELTHGGHTLTIHQVGRPRGFEDDAAGQTAPADEEEFESTFDGWPAENTPRAQIARWLGELPAREAPKEKAPPPTDRSNPFAAEPRPAVPRLEPEPSVNPFLADRPGPAGHNPFADPDRDRKRDELLRRLRGGDD